MSFKSGTPKPEGSGRKEGTPNKITKDIKESYRLLLEANLDNLSVWLNQVAMKDPAKALNIILSISEYVVPKLERSEVTTQTEQKPVIINFTERVREPELDYSKLTDEELRIIAKLQEKAVE